MIQLNARKVAFLGSSTSSRSLAPFEDKSWEIWATGPGCHNDPNFKSQFTRWFELHDMCDNDPQYGTVLDPGYFEWLQKTAQEKPVYYRPPLYEGLIGHEFPWNDIHPKHSGFFLDSTVAWMMAFLYEFGDVDEIGLWGIDFATEPERVAQRKGTKHFIELFALKGVKCFIPDLSEMAFDPLPYPDVSKMGKKIRNQLNQLVPERAKTEKAITDMEENLRGQREYLSRIQGTEQTLNHFKDNWT